MKIRVIRLKGFARGEAQEFDKSPVTLGASPECDIRFDSGWERTSPQHVRLEFDGSSWFVVDAGSSSGTFVRGQRISRPERIDGTLDVELGIGGPRVRLETVAPAPARVLPVAGHVRRSEETLPKPMATAAIGSPSSHQRLGRMSRLPMIAAGALTVLAIGGISWWLLSGKNAEVASRNLQPLPPLLDEHSSPSRANEPGEPEPGAEETQPVEAAAAPAQSGSVADKPAAGIPSLTAEEQAAMDRKKAEPMYRGLRQFWTEVNTQSPYTKSFLQSEDAWFAGLFAFLRGGNADRFTVPGLFIGEYFGPGTMLPGTPITPDTMVAALKPGVMAGGGDGVSRTVAVARPQRRNFTVPPKALASLKQSFQSKAGGEKPKAWAVLVGVNDFEFINDLTSCRNDVTALAKILSTQGIFELERIRLLTDARKGTPDYASKANVLVALRETLRNAAENDVVFICISGHGGYDKRRKDSNFYLADSKGVSEEGSESEYNEAAKTVFYGQELDELLAGAKARNVILA
ncbi:MAG: FHA domain-containing protein, partial [Chthoniobacteraceae bacterium]